MASPVAFTCVDPGTIKHALIEPPAAKLGELAAAHLEFLSGLGELLPRLALVDVEAQTLSDGLVELTCAVENPSLLPLMTSAASSARSVRPARVRLELPEGASLLAGAEQTLVRQLEGSGGRQELRWLVRSAAPSSLRITVDTDHAGVLAASPERN